MITENSIKLTQSLLNEKAENSRLLAKLWESDPQKYGADSQSIAHQQGRAEAFHTAVETLKSLAG